MYPPLMHSSCHPEFRGDGSLELASASGRDGRLLGRSAPRREVAFRRALRLSGSAQFAERTKPCGVAKSLTHNAWLWLDPPGGNLGTHVNAQAGEVSLKELLTWGVADLGSLAMPRFWEGRCSVGSRDNACGHRSCGAHPGLIHDQVSTSLSWLKGNDTVRMFVQM